MKITNVDKDTGNRVTLDTFGELTNRKAIWQHLAKTEDGSSYDLTNPS
jgi:hypothetical protein